MSGAEVVILDSYPIWDLELREDGEEQSTCLPALQLQKIVDVPSEHFLKAVKNLTLVSFPHLRNLR